MLVLKWLKIKYLMLFSQKNKCLVLSKYPHSDPLITQRETFWRELHLHAGHNVHMMKPFQCRQKCQNKCYQQIDSMKILF